MKSQSERKSDLKALKLKYPSSTQTPNLKNPIKLSSPSSVDEVGARMALGMRSLRLTQPLGLTPPLGRTAFGSRIWWWRPGHLVVAVVFLFLGLKHEKERAAFLGFFSSSVSFFFFFLAPSSNFCVCVVVLIVYLLKNRVSKTRFPSGRHVENVPT